VGQCVHLALAHADLVVLVAVVLAVQVLVAQAADQVVLVVLVLVVPVAVVLVADLVVLVAVVLVAAVLAVAETDNAVHQRRSHVLVVVKTSMKCCRRQPRRIRKAMLQFLKVLSLSSAVRRRKSLLQS
jgi:hypothetical protein